MISSEDRESTKPNKKARLSIASALTASNESAAEVQRETLAFMKSKFESEMREKEEARMEARRLEEHRLSLEDRRIKVEEQSSRAQLVKSLKDAGFSTEEIKAYLQ